PSPQYVARFAAKRNQPRRQISASLIGTSACKADKSACVAHFSVDSRNENLPEKCIHQNCASRPGGSRCRVFLACMRAPAVRLSVGDRAEDEMGFETRGVACSAHSCPAIDGCRNGSPPLLPCFRPVIYREQHNSAVFPLD